MPALITLALIAAVIARFPYTSVLSIVGTFCWVIWASVKSSKLKKLETQRYLDDVAAFQWRDNMDPIEFERRCADAMRFAGWVAQTIEAQAIRVLTCSPSGTASASCFNAKDTLTA